MLNSDFDAIVPMLCVTLAALASMGPRRSASENERMPIGGLGIIGLAGAGVSSVLLWNRSATGFGVIARRQLRPVRHARCWWSSAS